MFSPARQLLTATPGAGRSRAAHQSSARPAQNAPFTFSARQAPVTRAGAIPSTHQHQNDGTKERRSLSDEALIPPKATPLRLAVTDPRRLETPCIFELLPPVADVKAPPFVFHGKNGGKAASKSCAAGRRELEDSPSRRSGDVRSVAW